MAMDVDTGAKFSAFGGLINTPVYTLLDSTPDTVASLVWDEVR